MKAIVTKYHGPSSSRGSRYSANDLDGNRVTVSCDLGLNNGANRDAAAVALCRKKGWTGTLVRGSLGMDTVYVWLSDSEVVNVLPLSWTEVQA